MSFLKSNNTIFLTAICFFFIFPFLFWDNEFLVLGGDSSGTQFLFPSLSLKNIGLSAYNNLTGHLTNVSHLGFYIVLYILSLFSSDANILYNLINSLQLSLSFIFFFLLLEKLIKLHKLKVDNKILILSSLAYTLSPIILFEHNYINALNARFLTFCFPMILLCSLKYILNKSYRHILIQSLLLIFSGISLSIINISHLILFIIFQFIYLLYVVKLSENILMDKYTLILKYYFISILPLFFFYFPEFILVIEYFYNLVMNINVDNELGLKSISSKGNLILYNSLLPHLSITFPLLNLPHINLVNSYEHQIGEFLINYRYSIIYVIFLSIYTYCRFNNLIKINKIIYIEFAFLTILVLLIGNILFFDHIYQLIFGLPFSNIIRSFYSKFSLLFCLVYMLFMGVILTSLKDMFYKNKKIILTYNFLIIIFFATIFLNAINFINGSSHKNYYHYYDKDLISKISPNYFKKVFTKYLENNDYYKGVYLPPSYLKNLIFVTKEKGVYFGPNFFDFLSINNVITSDDKKIEKEIYEYLYALNQKSNDKEIIEFINKNNLNKIFLNKITSKKNKFEPILLDISKRLKKLNFKIEYEDDNLIIFDTGLTHDNNIKKINNNLYISKNDFDINTFDYKWIKYSKNNLNYHIYSIQYFYYFGLLISILSLLFIIRKCFITKK